MKKFRRLFWWIVAEDGENGVGFGIPSHPNDLFSFSVYHQETLGM